MSRGNIDDDSIVQYVIGGIQDLNLNKSILYAANNIKEFKKKLLCYEKFRSKEEDKINRKLENRARNNNDSNQNKTKNYCDFMCFNCSSRGHKSRECTNKEKGNKCIRCNKFGHIAKDCPENSRTNTRLLKSQNLNMTKGVNIGGKYSIVNSVCDTVFKNMNGAKLDKTDFQLVEFGQKRIKL